MRRRALSALGPLLAFEEEKAMMQRHVLGLLLGSIGAEVFPRSSIVRFVLRLYFVVSARPCVFVV